MSSLNLSVQLAAADKAAILTKIGEIKALLPFLINLTPKERQRLRKKGTKRAGYVDAVYNSLSSNPTVVPASFSMVEFTKDIEISKALQEILSTVSTLVEGIDDTILLAGNEEMTASDAGYDYLKRAAATNVAIQAEVANIAKAFEGQGKKKPKPIP